MPGAVGRKKARQSRERYIQQIKRYLPTITYVLYRQRLSPKLVNKLSPLVLTLLRDLFRNCVDSRGALFAQAQSDPEICRCRKILQDLAETRDAPQFRKVVKQQKGSGVWLPITMAAMAIPELIRLIRGQ